MKIKLLVSRVGANFSQSTGDVIDVPDAEAARMIAAAQAEPIARVAPEKATRAQRSEKRAK